MLGRVKITGDIIGNSGLLSVSDSVLGTTNALSDIFGDLPDTSSFASAVRGIDPLISGFAKSNGLFIGNEGVVREAECMREVLTPLSSQITTLPKFSEFLKEERIMAALDKPIIIDLPISKIGLNENINWETKRKTDFSGIEVPESKIKMSNSENHEKDEE